MGVTDPLSLRLSQPVSQEHAHAILNDESFREDCRRLGIAPACVAGNLALTPTQRICAIKEALEDLDLFALLRELTARRIRFVIIGGLAGRVYCSSFVTGDFDICHARDIDNLTGLAEMLADIGATYRRLPRFAAPLIDAATLATETDFVFSTQLGNFDLIGEFTGVGSYQNAAADALEITLADYPVKVMSLPKVMAAKKSTGRAKDQLVWSELELIARALCRIPAPELQVPQSV